MWKKDLPTAGMGHGRIIVYKQMEGAKQTGSIAICLVCFRHADRPEQLKEQPTCRLVNPERDHPEPEEFAQGRRLELLARLGDIRELRSALKVNKREKGPRYRTAHPEAERIERKLVKAQRHPLTPALAAAVARNQEQILRHKGIRVARQPRHQALTAEQSSVIMGLFLTA